TSLNGKDDESYVTQSNLPEFGAYDSQWSEPFYVYVGDEPFFQRRESNVFTLRASGERSWASGSNWKTGLGLHYADASLRQPDGRTRGAGYAWLRAYPT